MQYCSTVDLSHPETRILENVDYSDKNEIAALACFYEYISRKDESFLAEHDYSAEEVLVQTV